MGYSPQGPKQSDTTECLSIKGQRHDWSGFKKKKGKQGNEAAVSAVLLRCFVTKAANSGKGNRAGCGDRDISSLKIGVVTAEYLYAEGNGCLKKETLKMQERRRHSCHRMEGSTHPEGWSSEGARGGRSVGAAVSS